MWLIVGLGNPGRTYSRTRHNIGFLALEEIASQHTISLKYTKAYGYGKGFIDTHAVTLLEPLLYMNRSGPVVRKFLAKYHECNLIVLHDDIDLPLGGIRIKRRGSSGGHKGVESIVQHIGSIEFARVKIGIGRDPNMPVEEYVLRSFKRNELPHMKKSLRNAAAAVSLMITDGFDKAMNTFN